MLDGTSSPKYLKEVKPHTVVAGLAISSAPAKGFINQAVGLVGALPLIAPSQIR